MDIQLPQLRNQRLVWKLRARWPTLAPPISPSTGKNPMFAHENQEAHFA